MSIASAVDSFCAQINRASAPRRLRCTLVAALALVASVGAYALIEDGFARQISIACGASIACFAWALRPWLVSWSRLRRGIAASDALLGHLARSSRVPAEAKAAIAARVEVGGLVTIGFLADLDAHLQLAKRATRPGRQQILRFAPKRTGVAAA